MFGRQTVREAALAAALTRPWRCQMLNFQAVIKSAASAASPDADDELPFWAFYIGKSGVVARAVRSPSRFNVLRRC